MVRVKVCGFTAAVDVAAAEAVGVDYLGFNFHPGSRRYVEPSRAGRLVDRVTAARKVGVFVDAPAADIGRLAGRLGLDLVQLHGDETPDFCRRLKEENGLRIIKALPVSGPAVLERAAAFRPWVDYLLLDSPAPAAGTGFGGSGRPFDWSVAAGVAAFGCPFFLAGGLDPDNVGAAISRLRPDAVDVAGGVEIAPGRKDRTLMARFVAAVRAASPAGHSWVPI